MPEDLEVELPPDAATAEDNRNPRRREREQNGRMEVGLLVEPNETHELDRLVLYQETRDDILAGLRAIQRRDELEAVWKISEIQPQKGRCILNFYGDPGTGKTRAALGVAWRLGKPMYQVDYSAIISKYLGDTAKHIVLAFKRATEYGAVLFFDEADSLLSSRVSMDESCATSINQNRNCLMQELDRFNGVVVVTTNLFGNYDAALLRRIGRHIRFALPNAAMRVKLIEMHLPKNPSRIEVDLKFLAAESQGLSGGDILNACVNSIFAGSVDDNVKKWRINTGLVAAEIAKVKTAKVNHGGAQ